MVVEQRGIDIVVRASRDGETDVVEFQEEVRRTGQEQVDVVATRSGRLHRWRSPPVAVSIPARMPFAWSAVAPQPIPTARCMKRAGYARRRSTWRRQRRFDEAQRLFDRAITISEAVRGPDDVFVGMLLYDLVAGVLEMREFTRAEPLQRRALTIFDKSWGEDHPYSAMSRMRLAVLLLQAGQRVQAEASTRVRDAAHRARRSEQRTPGLRRASGRKRVSATARAISMPPRRSTGAQ